MEVDTTSIAIRAAESDDAEALAAFGTRTYAANYAHYWSAPALREYLARHFAVEQIAADLASRADLRVLLAEDEHGIAGYAKLVCHRALPTDPRETGAELEKLYVDVGRTRQGIGSMLVAHAADLGAQMGNPLIWLDVLKSNFSGIRLYQRLGFRIRGEVPFATDLRDIGMWVMSRP